MAEDESMHAAVANALDAIRHGDEEAALDELVPLIESRPDGLRSAVWELASANATMLRGPSGWTGDADRGADDVGDPEGIDDVEEGIEGANGAGEAAVAVQLCGPNGESVRIDEVEPALRAAVRILLAFLNGRPDDARLHLNIVEQAGSSPDEMLLVFLHTAGWTLALLDAGGDVGTPLPSWLRRLARQY